MPRAAQRATDQTGPLSDTLSSVVDLGEVAYYSSRQGTRRVEIRAAAKHARTRRSPRHISGHPDIDISL
jgi:hypothetical protein